ncbi:MAG: 16S rRNA (uracil(1498)-N(3))-methyltransferase [Hyphomicrobiaceae bacterium]|nr:16S rRNA (uracil(1498)-N(3))-methyltransferase [Hyphomicrobiaceae bacterium]
MAVRDFTSQRLFLAADLAAGAEIIATPEQANYLRTVLRMPDGARVLVFNGRDGEWSATVDHDGKRGVRLSLDAQTRAQETGPDLWYLFAPLKRSRLDYMVQKAVELGASRLVPVLTQHTIAERVNTERMAANAIEAAEQCGILRVPDIAPPEKLDRVLAAWSGAPPTPRHLIFCDESAIECDPIAVLRKLQPGPVAVLIGPEGGFSETERTAILSKPFAVALSLGPRIMRADTAAVAALTLVNATLCDWR